MFLFLGENFGGRGGSLEIGMKQWDGNVYSSIRMKIEKIVTGQYHSSGGSYWDKSLSTKDKDTDKDKDKDTDTDKDNNS